MSAPVLRPSAVPSRRGVCPGLSRPLPTGDGLLVRILPIGTIALDAFAGLCAAARAHGNGIVEITARCSIQVRGLSAHSAPRFADAIAALGIAAEDGVPILCNPLAGLDAAEIFDATAIAAALRRAVTQQSLDGRLDPKVSVVIDDGAPLNLARVAADIRVRAQLHSGQPMLRLAIGGDDRNAFDLGLIAPDDGVEAVSRLLLVLAERGARARDIIAAEGPACFDDAFAHRGSVAPRDREGAKRIRSRLRATPMRRRDRLACTARWVLGLRHRTGLWPRRGEHAGKACQYRGGGRRARAAHRAEPQPACNRADEGSRVLFLSRRRATRLRHARR